MRKTNADMTCQAPQQETDRVKLEEHGASAESGEGAKNARDEVDDWDRLAIVMAHP